MNILKTIVLSVVLLGHFYWNTQTHSSYFTTSKFATSNFIHPPHLNFTLSHSPLHHYQPATNSPQPLPSSLCRWCSVSNRHLALAPLHPLLLFPADTLSCQGTVTFAIPYTDTCTTAAANLYTALDLDIQAANPELPPTLADFMADQADANAYFTPSDTGFVFQGDFPIGTHGLHIALEDACGDRIEELLIFEVVDEAIPTPICEIGMRVLLVPTDSLSLDPDGDGDHDEGFEIVSAYELVASPIYDCSGQEAPNESGLREITNYSINRVGEESTSTQDSLILTQDDDETTIVEIHAWDESGNQSFCTTYILVDMSIIYSGGRTYVGGHIETEEGNGVAEVNVSIEGSLDQTIITQGDGYYQVSNFPINADIRITPYLNKDHLNGVTTLDLILIRRHILGITPLSSPYKLIAADITNDQLVTTLDIIELQKNILGLADDFTANTSWRFILYDHVFVNPFNPWETPFPERSDLNIADETIYTDFIAVKIGDVNGTAINY